MTSVSPFLASLPMKSFSSGTPDLVNSFGHHFLRAAFSLTYLSLVNLFWCYHFLLTVFLRHLFLLASLSLNIFSRATSFNLKETSFSRHLFLFATPSFDISLSWNRFVWIPLFRDTFFSWQLFLLMPISFSRHPCLICCLAFCF